MRHFLLSRPVTAHSGGVPPTAMRASLISPTSRLQGPLPCPGSAAAVTVDLPPIAAAANDYLASAAGAQEQTTTYNPGLLRAAATTETNALIGRILFLHSCPARCGARRRYRTCRSRSAPCLPESLAGTRRYVLPEPGPSPRPGTPKRVTDLPPSPKQRPRQGPARRSRLTARAV